MRLLVKEAAPLHDLMSVALLGGFVHVYAHTLTQEHVYLCSVHAGERVCEGVCM